MVFCYKIITESPRRSGSVSPRKKSPSGRISNFPSSLSELINTLDYEECSNTVLDSIPEREWRLLAAVARKREEDDEREKLADQFRKLWQKEKEERDIIEAETTEQYKRYIKEKRDQERARLEHRRLQRIFEQQMRKGQLLDCIRHKERRSADLLAWQSDIKVSGLIGKVVEEEARAQLAADKRSRIEAADEWRRRAELTVQQRRVEDAARRRSARLRDAAQRIAISNALNTWETTLLRQEVSAMDAARRAQHAAHATLTDARSQRLARARASRQKRARRMAAFTEQLREAVRCGRI